MFEGLLQPTHLIIILVIVLIIFGPGKLPELGSALGRGIKEFRGGIKDATEGFDDMTTTTGAPSAPVVTAPTVATPIPSTGMAATSMPNTMSTASPMTATVPQSSNLLLPSVCVKCGTSLGAGVRFCPSCGNKIDATA